MSAASATERVFEVAELIAMISEHLEDDRADLLTLSTLSQSFRFIALPILIRSISIKLDNPTAISGLKNLLVSNPVLIDHIHRIQVVDGATSATQAARIRKYRALEDILRLVHARHTRVGSLPLLDLTLCVHDLWRFLQGMQATPGFFESITAIRIVPSKVEVEERACSADVMEAAIYAQWDDLCDLVRLTREAQGDASSAALRLFHYTDRNTPATDFVFDHIADELKTHLAPCIEDLAITADEDNVADPLVPTLLTTEWPRLRRIHLDVVSPDGDSEGRLRGLVQSFLAAKPNLDFVTVRREPVPPA
ncbi:hypothetical protein V8E36_003569 [Tilletia maclaganii]